METYRYVDGSPLGAPISAFAARDDLLVPFNRVTAWQKQTSSAFTLRLLRGDHMLTGRAWRHFARAVASDLAADAANADSK
jgi:medium-chain acyl-[acyl-carrier-protein] hydrolase